MMWVVQAAVDRLKQNVGEFRFSEWRECADVLEIGIEYIEIPLPYRAFTVAGIIFIQRHMSSFEQAWWGWHEISHCVMHDGCATWWATRPQGHVTVAKFERQATEFAALFPDWGD